MKRNKKGISLAIVIVVVMALMIFSAMLFSAASHSLSMTGESTDGRQTYLTAKSAIEFSKTTAFDLAKAGSLKPFAVTIGADGSFTQDTGVSPDSVAGLNLNGTNDCAKCWNTGGNTWKMLANIKYKNSAKFRQLAYTFTLTTNASVNLPASDFMTCGVNYGTYKIFSSPFSHTVFYSRSSGNGISIYPVVETNTIYANGNDAGADSKNGSSCYVKAPEIFFLGQSPSIYSYHGSTEIDSNYVFIGGNVTGVAYTDTDRAYLYLRPQDGSTAKGIVYFQGSNGVSDCVITCGSASVSIPSGYYQFDGGINLFGLGALQGGAFRDSSNKMLTKLTDEEQGSVHVFKQDIAFLHTYQNVLNGDGWNSSCGADFTSNGVFAGSPTQRSKKSYDGHWYANNDGQNRNALDINTVFTYATSVVKWSSSAVGPQYSDPYGESQPWSGNYIIFPAKQFFLRFVSPTNNFVLPGSYNAVFHSDLVSLSMAVSDTSAGTNVDSRPKIVQATNGPTSQFLLTSLSTDASGNHKDVTLAVQNDIKVVYSGGSYVIPSGIYSVQSGFNFFDSENTWSSFWTSCRKGGYPVPGSGGSGGAGGFTITPGAYSGS